MLLMVSESLMILSGTAKTRSSPVRRRTIVSSAFLLSEVAAIGENAADLVAEETSH